MTSIKWRAVPVLAGMVLALTAFGGAPALAATTQHGVLRAVTQASRPAHVARPSAAPLFSGGKLKPGAFLDSGTVTLVMQSDGNLVLYRDGHVGDPNWALWSSGTTGHNTAVMQGDGNFVIYPSKGVGQPGKALWATHTSGNNVLEVQNDGNVVIYPSCCIGSASAALWATNTKI